MTFHCKSVTSRHNMYDKKFHKRRRKFAKWQRAIAYTFAEALPISSVLDCGCGLGFYLEGFLEKGMRISGAEYDLSSIAPYVSKDVLPFLEERDLTEESEPLPKVDLVLSFEVAEHLPPESTESFLKRLVASTKRYIAFSAAKPGQKGIGHINCREWNEWEKMLEDLGCRYLEETEAFREAWVGLGVPKYQRRNFMLMEILE